MTETDTEITSPHRLPEAKPGDISEDPEEAPTAAPDQLVNGSPDERDEAVRADAMRRRRECNTAITEVLVRYSCRLMAVQHQPEWVGENGDKYMVAASVQVVPQPMGQPGTR